ncbi:MAG: molybdopterin-binding protein [Chloroflexaceae bacterium]|nr:molybdopterin-binding protein [Chloroflexaceae bacterium]
MKFGPVPIEEALGKVLAHKLFDADGRKLLNKGHRLIADDLDLLRRLDMHMVIVADLAPTDLDENAAARRVGHALVGEGLQVRAPGVGRANLHATVAGPLRINVPVLNRLNNIDEGITIATLQEHTLVQAGQQIALVKIIPFGMVAARVEDVEAVAREYAPVLSVRALQPHRVGLIVSGPAHARDHMLEDFTPPVRTRMERLGSQLDQVRYVAHTAEALADGIRQQIGACDLIILAGISATIDREDVIPLALRAAGGGVAHFGVPVDPGSLLMLGYIDHKPVLGAPGCVRSLKTNVVDLILPRLLAGERLTRADLVAMGHGGLLKDISERPMPRDLPDE